MDIRDLLKIIESFFGKKAKQYMIESEKREISCLLYDSFQFKCGFEGQYGNFNGGIIVGDSYVVTKFFGEFLSLNNDEESIIKSLEKVDQYCRLRLPDKFLNAYEEAYLT
ncbi:hypothetical protein ACFSCX_24020 [Bacillus salitolerans]|uniref:Uncharacterized protein n=1 Tax=Bacillus salitolerans TaxID=1437434 RepID=A0ABW4LYD0_9BACI